MNDAMSLKPGSYRGEQSARRGVLARGARLTMTLLAAAGMLAASGFAQAPPPDNGQQDQGQYNQAPPPDNGQQDQGQYNQGPPPDNGQQDQGQYNPPPPPPPAENQQPMEQQAGPPPATMAPNQLDQLVARIALYPDPLLAQVLTASTYFDQIPQAAQWADQHNNIKGDALANAIREDNLQWDPSVMALLPFPSVLDMMANDPNWTQQLGNEVLAQRPAVMDAVQHMRSQAHQYGYLKSNPYDRVQDDDGEYEILPTNPAYIYVPTYDPYLVFGPPRPGFFVGGAVRFGPAIVLGASFYPWGWAHPYFGWRSHDIFFDATPWRRGWVNRGYYVHPYARGYSRGPGPRVERHEVVRGGRRR